ncbi:MAG TPA: DUF5985 family protein [Pseudolabrys sp.]|nr:DUF5985 family protein [Pseudolabrys sp.]
MSETVNAVLSGAVAMASFVVMLFFFRFWRQTRDRFFLFFAVGFGLDALSRFALGLTHPSDETEPLFYLARLVTFGLIIAAIVEKNWPNKGRNKRYP